VDVSWIKLAPAGGRPFDGFDLSSQNGISGALSLRVRSGQALEGAEDGASQRLNLEWRSNAKARPPATHLVLNWNARGSKAWATSPTESKA